MVMSGLLLGIDGRIIAPHPRPVKAFRILTQKSAQCMSAGMLIFKIFRRPEWNALCAAGQTAGAPVDLADGFVHFSTAAQVAETAARHFADQSDLVLVAAEADALGADLRWEASRGGALFPHLYRVLRKADVVWDKALPLGATGHIFPEGHMFSGVKCT
jgi:uncharacterized protein (DUF952 family)